MKSINRKITGALALVITGGGLFLGAGSASAATPPFEPDPHTADHGSITLYNAAGQPVTSGTNLNHLFDYAVASSASSRQTNKATLQFAFPDHTKADSIEWYAVSASGSTTFPLTNAPGEVANAGTKPTVALTPGQGNLNAAIGGAVVDTTPGYANLVQIRLRDSGPGVPQEDDFWGVTISYDQTAKTWTQVYPAVATATNTTLTATPTPSTVGDTVTLKATVTPTAAGTVQFKDGTTNINSPVTVNGSGVATTTSNAFGAGSHTLAAVFTPTSATDYKSSTGTTTIQVNPAATPTTTVLALSGGYTTAGSPATLTANVTGPGATPNGAGTVKFYDNGSASPLAGTVSTPSAGTYVLDVPAGFATGAHSIVAKFAPNDISQYEVSQSAAQAFTTSPAQGSPCAQPGSQCTDPQSIQATVPVGTLVIDTPYTPSSPLDVGTLKLNADATKFDGVASFNDIKVTDTRAGNLPWTAKALASSLTNGSNHANGVINGQNVGLVGLAATKGAGFTGTVVTTDNGVPATAVGPTDPGTAGLGGATAHTIATADRGTGTVTMRGTLIVQAPSSTEAGLYTGTITFTVG